MSDIHWMQYSEDRDVYALVPLLRTPTIDQGTGRTLDAERNPVTVELYVDPSERYWSVSIREKVLAEGYGDDTAACKGSAIATLHDLLSFTSKQLETQPCS